MIIGQDFFHLGGKMFKTVMLLLVMAAFSQGASAYDLSKKFGLGLNGGYSIPLFGNPFNSDSDSSFSYGVEGRYHFNESFNLEVNVSRSSFADSKTRFDNLNTLAVWRLNATSDFTPVLGAGIGFTKIKNYTPNNIKLSGLLRAGVEYNVTQWFSVGALADYQYVSKFLGAMPTKRAHVLTPQVALTWYFGGGSSSLEKAEADIKAENEAKNKTK
jgi:hypothetical protein